MTSGAGCMFSKELAGGGGVTCVGRIKSVKKYV